MVAAIEAVNPKGEYVAFPVLCPCMAQQVAEHMFEAGYPEIYIHENIDLTLHPHIRLQVLSLN